MEASWCILTILCFVAFVLCLVSRSCPTLLTPQTPACQAPLSMGIPQARMLEWAAMSSSRGSSQPRDRTQVSCTGASLIAQSVKNRPAMLETLVQFLGWEDQLQKG